MRLFIFLLEDNPAELEVFKLRLKQSVGKSDSILTATSGDEAIESIKNSNPKPNIFILDLNMPGRIKGKDVLRWLNNIKEFDTCAKIILSSSTQEQDRQDCFDIGCDEYCVKPASGLETKVLIKRIVKAYGDRGPTVDPSDSFSRLTEKVKGLFS